MPRYLIMLLLVLAVLGGIGSAYGPTAARPADITAIPLTPRPVVTSGAEPTATEEPTLVAGTAIPATFAVATATPTNNRPTSAYTGTVEWQFTDDGPPHPAAVLKDGAAPWFGYAGARVYLSWQAGDPEAVVHLPPVGCLVRPLRNCASVCPVPLSCFVGVSTYRHSSATERWVVLVLTTVPFNVGQPGDPVTFRDPGDGTVRWRLP